MISCLAILFETNEKNIYEDFLEITELTETEIIFENRSRPFDLSDLNIGWLGYPAKTFTKYHDIFAVLNEECEKTYGCYLATLHWHLSYVGTVWFLGLNDVDLSNIHSNEEVKCGKYSCYEKSSREGKICKQGKVYLC